jgi:hypothetical protein
MRTDFCGKACVKEKGEEDDGRVILGQVFGKPSRF